MTLRKSAAETLGKMGSEEAVEALEQVMMNPKVAFDFRVCAAGALGKTGSDKAVEALKK
eukprot:CAMPEP_0198527384 /NCGR_PEP_ID=MMETSP1462-20131121/24523_1 /TAXON_ID=1333877 /ORGANISM="Brandtodinium nutriculum, Strain RCC3387" /LENGTH=58 /DNA_ID=CAMNT_0044257189 /DNA_START=38 /DNA_END=211 /DNA_ORIENTATION=+